MSIQEKLEELHLAMERAGAVIVTAIVKRKISAANMRAASEQLAKSHEISKELLRLLGVEG